eukprot:g809.t1
MSCRPATQCCCGCSLEFGAYCFLGLNLLRCLLFIFVACDAVLHADQNLYLQIEGSLAHKVSLAAMSITGATFTVFAIYGVSTRMTQASFPLIGSNETPQLTVMLAAPPALDSAEPPAKRARTDGVVVPSGISALHHIEDWYEQNKERLT